MNVPAMSTGRRILLLIAAGSCLAALSGCGSESRAGAPADSDEPIAANVAADRDEDDHGDEDHGDEDDHGDEEDHGDEDHGDEDDHGGETSGGIGAHVHGEAELFVAWSGGEMVVDLISPADNIFGFEREPSTDEERLVAAERSEALSAPGVIEINVEAGCALAGEVTPELIVEGTHAEVTTSWLFACDNPGEIEQLDATRLFAEFPGLVDVDAQWASESGQSAAELSPSSTILRFE